MKKTDVQLNSLLFVCGMIRTSGLQVVNDPTGPYLQTFANNLQLLETVMRRIEEEQEAGK